MKVAYLWHQSICTELNTLTFGELFSLTDKPNIVLCQAVQSKAEMAVGVVMRHVPVMEKCAPLMEHHPS